VYFHIQAIKEQNSNFLSNRHVELIYATLASWGMHRMGDPEETKAKLVEFSEFRDSILSQREKLSKFISVRMDSCSLDRYASFLNEIRDIYCGLRVSISDATIVAHSKTLAHIFPHFIPPIDRQYTIRFFTQDNKEFFTDSGKYKIVNVPRGMDAQFDDFKKYSYRMKALFDQCDHRLFVIDSDSFNTSYPKIIDNLLMAFVKDVPKPTKSLGKHNRQ
jgi:hypothetical protein